VERPPSSLELDSVLVVTGSSALIGLGTVAVILSSETMVVAVAVAVATELPLGSIACCCCCFDIIIIVEVRLSSRSFDIERKHDTKGGT